MKKVSQEVSNFWKEFCEINPQVNPDTPFQVWYFGLSHEDAEELCNLVLEGKKTATASLPAEYEKNPEDAPIVGGYSVVTDFDGNPNASYRRLKFALFLLMRLMRNLLLMKAKATRAWITGARFIGIIFQEDASKLE